VLYGAVVWVVAVAKGLWEDWEMSSQARVSLMLMFVVIEEVAVVMQMHLVLLDR